MDPIPPFVPLFLLFGLPAVLLAVSAGWVLTTWLRIRNGYPLGTSRGKLVYPQRDAETEKRMHLLTQENAQLRADIGAIRDQLATVERTLTDGAIRRDREVDALRSPAH